MEQQEEEAAERADEQTPNRPRIRSSISSVVVKGQPTSLALQNEDRRSVLIVASASKSGSGFAEPLTRARLPELQDEIGVSSYHRVAFVILLFIPFCEGAGLHATTHISHALKHQYHWAEGQTASLETFSCIGLACGTYISGFFADLKGRRLPMVTSYLGISLASLCMVLVDGYRSMAFLRLIHGFASGIGVPAAMAMVSEIMPTKWREGAFILFWSFTAAGETYTSCGLMLFMPDLDLSDPSCWKKVVLWSAFPAFLMLLLSVASLQESPAWLLVRGHLVDVQRLLARMAHRNGKTEVLRKLGPEQEYDLSNMFGAAGIHSRKIAPREQRYEAIKRALLEPATLKLVALFAVLAAVGSVTTQGMSELWSDLFRQLEHEDGSHSFLTIPAHELTILSFAGIPVGILGSWLTSNKIQSHRFWIFMTAIFGICGLVTCARVMRMPAVFTAGMLLTQASAILQYSVAMVFCEETFPTSIRSSATGIVIFFGTLWEAVASPFVLTMFGQERFILFAGFSFLSAAGAASLLTDTSGSQLTDYHEGASPSAEAQEAAAEAEEDESEQESDQDEDEALSTAPSMTWSAPCLNNKAYFFPDGTLGSFFELSILLGLLGLVPGASFATYYASMGYFIDRCKDRSFFATALLVGNLSAVPMMVIMPRLGAFLDRYLSIHASIFIRLIISIFFLAVVDIAMAFIEGKTAMLLAGFLQGLLNVMILNTSSTISEVLGSRATCPVPLGFMLGAGLPVVTDALVGYGPGSKLSTRVAFYSFPACLCLIIDLFYWSYHRQVAKVFDSPQEKGKGNINDFARAYHALESRARGETPVKASANEPTGNAETPQQEALQGTVEGGMSPTPVAILLLLYQVSAYFFAGLFPMIGDPRQALNLYLRMAAADMMGSLLAYSYNCLVGFKHESNRLMFVSLCLMNLGSLCAAVAPAAITIAGITHADPRSSPQASARFFAIAKSLVSIVFFLGSFSKGGLEKIYPRIMKARLLGALIGLLSVQICYSTVLSSYIRPPKVNIQVLSNRTDSNGLSSVASRVASHLQRRAHRAWSADVRSDGLQALLRREKP